MRNDFPTFVPRRLLLCCSCLCLSFTGETNDALFHRSSSFSFHCIAESYLWLLNENGAKKDGKFIITTLKITILKDDRTKGHRGWVGGREVKRKERKIKFSQFVPERLNVVVVDIVLMLQFDLKDFSWKYLWLEFYNKNRGEAGSLLTSICLQSGCFHFSVIVKTFCSINLKRKTLN